jgi:hypothetical protein
MTSGLLIARPLITVIAIINITGIAANIAADMMIRARMLYK